MESLSIARFFVKGGRGALQLFLSQKGNHDKHNRWVMLPEAFPGIHPTGTLGFYFP